MVDLTQRDHALAGIEGFRVYLRGTPQEAFYLRLGNSGAGIITPGPTLEEALLAEAGAWVVRPSPVKRRDDEAQRLALPLIFPADISAPPPGAAEMPTWLGAPPSSTALGDVLAAVTASPLRPLEEGMIRRPADVLGHLAVSAEDHRADLGLTPSASVHRMPDGERQSLYDVLDLEADEDDGYELGNPSQRSNARGLEGFVAAADWDVVMAVEVERARRWLAADKVLGLVLLLGPMQRRTYESVRERREEGYLDAHYGLTLAGYWRLAYLARQGIGKLERRRAAGLIRATPLARRERQVAQAEGRGASLSARRSVARGSTFGAYHLRRVQRQCLQLMTEGATPLGVEFSALGYALQAELQWRPDALLVRPDGRLIWIETNIRPLAHLGRDGDKYRDLETRFMLQACNRLGRPCELHLSFGADDRRTVVYTPGAIRGRVRGGA